jgi:hypothetical protein
VQDAKRNLVEALAIAKDGDDWYIRHNALIFLASGIANQKPEAALRIAAALYVRQTNVLKEPIDPFHQKEQDRVLDQAHLMLGPSAFDAAWSEGEKMTVDQAINLALKTLDEL